MQIAIPAQGTISWVRPVFKVTAALLLFFVWTFAFARPASAQLALSNNYFVTGDYIVGGVGLRGLGVNGIATGTINIPDQNSVPATGVPAGADIVAAYLYWETVESSNAGAATGMQGSFNGYAITGTIRGNPNAPTSWSTGGCAGSSLGSKTMRVYRADVRPYLPLDSNGNFQTPNASTPGKYQVQLADSGSNGGGVPLTLGASLVIVYRVQSPQVPLNSIVLYDGALAPSNSSSTMTLPLQGFYDAAASPIAKITHIVGNGQPNKSETVYLNTTTLNSLYTGLPPFPGIYNQNTISASGGGSWDNPTWTSTTAVPADASSAMAQVVPSSSNSGCVNWGAVIFSTTVQSSDGDGLLDAWKNNKDQNGNPKPGYIDVNPNTNVLGNWVALPGAVSGQKDLFVELDYVTSLSGSTGHSHLPKQAALDKVGDALLRAGVHVHFDLGPGIYQNQNPPDPYVIQYSSIPAPPGGATTYPNAGGNAISEGNLVACKDATTTPLCPFPGVATVGWKGDLEFVQSQTTLGNFQPGRKDSYHYVLFGHALGAPRTYWSAIGAAPSQAGSGIATLVSIEVKNDGSGTITLNNPPYVMRPGDACTDVSCDRITIEGALQDANAKLNGTYTILGSVSNPTVNTSTSMTTVTIQTTGVTPGTYVFKSQSPQFSEPQLGVTFGGPTSDSGFSDIGGGDSAVTFGLWAADNATSCQTDPSKLTMGQVACTDQVGTTTAQAGTLLHELGHTFFLSHGGTYFPNSTVITTGLLAGQQTNDHREVPNVGFNCNPGYLSSMNYLFQIRGFPDGGAIDYSSQTLGLPNQASLSEGSLVEQAGIGNDLYGTNAAATHFSRWFAPPNALDMQLQSAVGGHFAGFHCDGSPITDGAQMVRVDGSAFFPLGATFSAPIDWNHNLALDTSQLIPQDVDFNGTTSDSFQGFSDWVNLDLRQIGARANAFGFSGGGSRVGGGGSRVGGGGSRVGGGGSRVGGGGSRVGGGGTEQDTDTANSTVDAPAGLTAAMNGHSVLLNWTAPEFGQIRSYSIWRAAGLFKTLADVYSNRGMFTRIGSVTTPTPPSTNFLDGTVKNNTTYTYFVLDMNKQGVQSGPSATVIIAVKF
jgi:hypothetical protein